MKLSHKILLVLSFIVIFFLVLVTITRGDNFALFNPAGQIALKERNLMILTLIISLVVVIPVFVMTFGIAWKYRAENTKAEYRPNWDNNVVAETLWWGIPCLIILILSVVAWKSSHELDPSKPIVSSVPPITVDVIALDWKWLFIYPQQHIASVNMLEIPQGTPINFEITSDAPMNSFWIPQLGGQIYAMPGMTTQLHLIADQPGTFQGLSANISGEGFAGMKFAVQSTSEQQFQLWVDTAQASSQTLDANTYASLSAPSENNQVAYYTANDSTLFGNTVMKFMMQMQPSSMQVQASVPASLTVTTTPSSQANMQNMHMDNMQMSNMGM